jgi:hypothetical protein
LAQPSLDTTVIVEINGAAGHPLVVLPPLLA